MSLRIKAEYHPKNLRFFKFIIKKLMIFLFFKNNESKIEVKQQKE